MNEKSFALIGLMGTGKTTLGPMLANALNLPFYDSDDLIVKRAGFSIPEIFENQGEDVFRAMEYEVIRDALSREICVLSSGGGAFIQEKTRSVMKDKAITIWLKAEQDLLVSRLQGTESSRPMLAGSDLSKRIQDLVEARYPVYAEADYTFMCQEEPEEHSFLRLLNYLKK